MLFYYLTYLLVIVLRLSIAQHSRVIVNNHDKIISISSVLGTPLLFNTEILDRLTNDEDLKTITWYKDIHTLLISDSSSANFTVSSQSRFQIVNRTKLLIIQTITGDEGFYTLKIQTKSNIYKQYLYHAILFTQNLSLFLSPSSYHYHAEQQINLTCSITFFANQTYIEQSRSLFLYTWHMIIYNNDPDHYRLLSSSNSYTYIARLLNYELNRNDHNQTISCALIEQQTAIDQVTLTKQFNIQYKAYLRGNYYFTRSFNAYSSIEINCEEFDANPKPVYTLLSTLNGENRTLLNKTKHGRYLIHNATWRNRGNYTCLAENVLNNHQPAHQSFRLNIWFHEHQSKADSILALEYIPPLNENRSLILIILILIFLVACFSCSLSLYCFCCRMK